MYKRQEVVRPGRKGETLKVSRAQAMYAILLYEQAEYVETMRNEGIGEAEVARPVSYTHLDVYKRQGASGCLGPGSGRGAVQAGGS